MHWKHVRLILMFDVAVCLKQANAGAQIQCNYVC